MGSHEARAYRTGDMRAPQDPESGIGGAGPVDSESAVATAKLPASRSRQNISMAWANFVTVVFISHESRMVVKKGNKGDVREGACWVRKRA